MAEKTEEVAPEPSPETGAEKVEASAVEKKPSVSGEDRDSVGIVKCVLVAIICSVLSVVAYDQFFAQKIVALDLKGIVDEVRDQAAAGKITQADVDAKFDAIEGILSSTPKRKVILMGDAVIKNVEILKP